MSGWQKGNWAKGEIKGIFNHRKKIILTFPESYEGRVDLAPDPSWKMYGMSRDQYYNYTGDEDFDIVLMHYLLTGEWIKP